MNKNTIISSEFHEVDSDTASAKYDLSELPLLNAGEILTLSKQTYLVKGFRFHNNPATDGFYYALTGEDEKQYLLRLYFRLHKNSEELKSTSLFKLLGINNSAIPKIIDYGTGIKKYKYKFCYEIYERSHYSLLFANLIPDFSHLRNTVLVQIFDALNTLHENDLFLCTATPDSFFYADDSKTKIILSNFLGSTFRTKNPVLEKIDRSRVDLIDFFTAPEVFDGIFTAKSDFYSIGMMLLKLFYPQYYEKSAFKNFVKLRLSGNLPIEFDHKLWEINPLIENLIHQDSAARWDFNTIISWLSTGKAAPVQGGVVSNVKVFSLSDTDISFANFSDFVSYLENEDEWYKFLLRNEQDSANFLDWLGEKAGIDVKNYISSMLVEFYDKNPDYLTENLRRFFSPNDPVKFGKFQLDLSNPNEVKESLEDFSKFLNAVWKSTDRAEIKKHIFNLLIALLHIGNNTKGSDKEIYFSSILRILNSIGIATIEELYVLASPVFVLNSKAIINLLYELNPSKMHETANGEEFSDIVEIGAFYAVHPDAYKDKYALADLKAFILKNKISGLIDLPLKEFLFNCLMLESEYLINIKEIIYTGNNKYRVDFSIVNSLTSFLKTKGVLHPLENVEVPKAEVLINKSLFSKPERLIDSFINEVKTKYNIPINKINKKNFEETGAKIAALTKDNLKISSLFIWLIISILIILPASYFTQLYFDNLLMVFQKENWIYYAGLYFLPILFLYFFIISFLFFKKGIKKTGLVLMLLSVISGGFVYLTYDHLKKDTLNTIVFKKKLFAAVYLEENTGTDSLNLKSADLNTIFRNSFLSDDPDIIAYTRFSVINNSLNLVASLPLLSRKIVQIDDFNTNVEFTREEIQNIPGLNSKYSLVSAIQLPGTQLYFDNNSYSFKAEFKNLKFNNDTENAGIGISFNRYIVLLTPNHIELARMLYPPSGDELKYLLVECSYRGINFTSPVRMTRSDEKANAISSFVFPVDFSKHFAVDLIQGTQYNISISVIKEKIFVKVNNEIIVNEAFDSKFWDLDNVNFPTTVGLAYQPFSNVSLEGIKLIDLIDADSGVENSYLVKKLTGKLKPSTEIYEDDKRSKTINSDSIGDLSISIITESNGLIKIKSMNGKIYYCNLNDIETINWN